MGSITWKRRLFELVKEVLWCWKFFVSDFFVWTNFLLPKFTILCVGLLLLASEQSFEWRREYVTHLKHQQLRMKWTVTLEPECLSKGIGAIMQLVLFNKRWPESMDRKSTVPNSKKTTITVLSTPMDCDIISSDEQQSKKNSAREWRVIHKQSQEQKSRNPGIQNSRIQNCGNSVIGVQWAKSPASQ